MSSGRYPRKVSVNFRKLEEKSLWNYVSLHNIDLEGQIRPSKEELEIICAEHFAQWEVDEEKVVESWISHMNTDRDVRELGAVKKRNRSEFSPYGPYGHGEAPAFGGKGALGGGGGGPGDPDSSIRGVVPSGEQVAAKVTNTNENGSWILAEIIRYLAGRRCYEVKDADDPMKQIEVPADSVIRLTDGGQGFAKGDNVLAVFPDTTSFYRATISKQPIRKAGVISEVVVQFEDDADPDTGKTPHRRINSKLVLAQPGGHYAVAVAATSPGHTSCDVATCVADAPPTSTPDRASSCPSTSPRRATSPSLSEEESEMDRARRAHPLLFGQQGQRLQQQLRDEGIERARQQERDASEQARPRHRGALLLRALAPDPNQSRAERRAHQQRLRRWGHQQQRDEEIRRALQKQRGDKERAVSEQARLLDRKQSRAERRADQQRERCRRRQQEQIEIWSAQQRQPKGGGGRSSEQAPSQPRSAAPIVGQLAPDPERSRVERRADQQRERRRRHQQLREEEARRAEEQERENDKRRALDRRAQQQRARRQQLREEETRRAGQEKLEKDRRRTLDRRAQQQRERRQQVREEEIRRADQQEREKDQRRALDRRAQQKREQREQQERGEEARRAKSQKRGEEEGCA